jgi:CheY-like chemotaxis protein/anti-sigma regulatory factor (Ser/Thr protein kinase)
MCYISAMAGKSVLVVDDDPAIHDLLRYMLKAENWQVEGAKDGDEALSRLVSGSFDLVVTDIVMPGMDGLALLKRIREVRPLVKVVVITAVNTPTHVVQSIRDQAYSYLSKPFSREAVLETLHAAFMDAVGADDIVVHSARPNWVSVELRCKLSTADRLTQFFRELSADLEPEDREMISTAFRELLMNAIEHGGGCDPDQKVNLTFVRGARCILYYIRDPGEGFSFEKLPHAAVSNSPEQPFAHAEVRGALGIRPGGFGILLSWNFADEVIYNERGNEVVLIKYLNP